MVDAGASEASLADVARRAGVSPATASRALNGMHVRPDSRDRVLAAAAALGYRANLAARTIARGFGDTLAVLVPDLRDPEDAAFARAIVDASDSVVTVATCPPDADAVVSAVRRIAAYRPRALIFGDFDLVTHNDLVRRGLDDTGVRSVVRPFDSEARRTEESDAADTVAEAVRVRTIDEAVVVDRPGRIRRGDLLVSALRDAGVTVRARVTTSAVPPLDDAATLDDALNGALAVVCADDTLALSVNAALRRRGRSALVAGVGGAVATGVLFPGTITVSLDAASAAERALRACSAAQGR